MSENQLRHVYGSKCFLAASHNITEVIEEINDKDFFFRIEQIPKSIGTKMFTGAGILLISPSKINLGTHEIVLVFDQSRTYNDFGGRLKETDGYHNLHEVASNEFFEETVGTHSVDANLLCKCSYMDGEYDGTWYRSYIVKMDFNDKEFHNAVKPLISYGKMIEIGADPSFYETRAIARFNIQRLKKWWHVESKIKKKERGDIGNQVYDIMGHLRTLNNRAKDIINLAFELNKI